MARKKDLVKVIVMQISWNYDYDKLCHSGIIKLNWKAKKSISNNELYHHGVKGQKWGERRYQNEDGSLTDSGRSHYEKDFEHRTVNNDKKSGTINMASPSQDEKEDSKKLTVSDVQSMQKKVQDALSDLNSNGSDSKYSLSDIQSMLKEVNQMLIKLNQQ